MLLDVTVQPDYEGLLSNLRREGTPGRVYHMELFLDLEVHKALHARFGTADHLDPADPWYDRKAYLALYRFLGYDTFTAPLDGLEFPRTNRLLAEDTSALPKDGGRRWARIMAFAPPTGEACRGWRRRPEFSLTIRVNAAHVRSFVICYFGFKSGPY